MPAPAPVAEPFFSGGDWITLGVGVVAAVIAFFAGRAARDSAREAKRSADAAVRSAKATERANTIAVQRDQREQHEKLAARQEAMLAEQARQDAAEREALGEAGAVRVQYAYNGGTIEVIITNNSRAPIRDVLLVDVRCFDCPDLAWQRNPMIVGGPQERIANWAATRHTPSS